MNARYSTDARMSTKALDILRDAGFLGLARRSTGFLYRRTIRKLLPKAGAVRYSGIAISRDRKWGDLSVPAFMVPFMLEDIPNYEAVLINALRSNVQSGDTVVVVGGGEGVTVTVSAEAVGAAGSVVCFEGNESFAENVRITAARNGVSERVTVRHAIVGKDVNVYSDYGGRKSTTLVMPEDLPNCDVLELDCEGAETVILKHLKFSPRVIIVETHGINGAPTTEVRMVLQTRGYHVLDLGWAEPNLLDNCARGDIRVLAAQRRLP
jgi:hypothetical protein